MTSVLQKLQHDLSRALDAIDGLTVRERQRTGKTYSILLAEREGRAGEGAGEGERGGEGAAESGHHGDEGEGTVTGFENRVTFFFFQLREVEFERDRLQQELEVEKEDKKRLKTQISEVYCSLPYSSS